MNWDEPTFVKWTLVAVKTWPMYILRLMYLKVIAIVNRSSSEGPSGHTNRRDYVFMRKDRSGYQTTVKLTYLRVIVPPW